MPPLTAVVVSFNERWLLERCLEHLVPQAQAAGADVIVVRRAEEPGDDDPAGLGQRFPSVAWIRPDARSTIPRMRALGVAQAGGAIVALIEDDCLVDTDWVHAVLAAHARSDAAAIGGPVEPGAYSTTLDWAAYFCDYGRFMRPVLEGTARALPGNNVSYKRAAVADVLRLSAGEGLQEAFVHDALSASGADLRMDATIVVRNVHRWNASAVSSVPYHHGRAFAGRRAAGWSLPRRALFAAATAGLPLLLGGRILLNGLRRPHVGRLLSALPWIVLFGVSWSAGELVGSLRGPGRSLERWR